MKRTGSTQQLLLISQHFEPSSGATAQLMSDLARGLHSRGWPIKVLTATPGEGMGFPVVRLSGSRRKGGIPIGILGKSLSGIDFSIRSLLWCWHRCRRGDGVLIVSNPPFIGLVGPLLQIARGIPYVFILQDLFPRSAVLGGVLPAGGKMTMLWQSLMGKVCCHSYRTVVLSKGMAKRLQQDHGYDLPISVIHNWAVERGAPIERAQNSFAAEHGFADRFCVQYSGNFGRLHDISTLLEAATKLKEAHIQFTFIGGGFKQRQIERYISEFALKNVLLLPYQPRARLSDSLAACDIAAIGLVPGAEDTIAPSKFYGILASARPVLLIAKRECDLAELVSKTGCGVVVEPGNASELAEKLIQLSQEDELVRTMGKLSLALYQQKFGLQRSLERYEAVLGELLNRKP